MASLVMRFGEFGKFRYFRRIYFSLFRLLEYAGEPKKVNYLFLGDYVDRGRQSIETIILMMCYKVWKLNLIKLFQKIISA